MAVTNLDVGDSYTIQTQGYAGTKGLPPWMEWVADHRASGTAELPSGYRHITKTEVDLINMRIDSADVSVDVAPITLPEDATCPWRCAIYAPNGAYLIANGLTGVPTVGTPRVRLTRSAPSRAVVNFALGIGKDNLLGACTRWSDGTARPIERGMELTVAYRDEVSGALVPCFRGRIYQIESGETITVTAYDRLMDLYQTTGQYLSHAGQEQDVKSQSRTASGSDYVYAMGVPLGVLTGLDVINRVRIDALDNMSKSMESTNDIIVHPLPSTDGVTPVAGDTILRIKAKVSGEIEGRTATPAGQHTAILAAALNVTVYVYLKQDDTFVQMAQGTGNTVMSASRPTAVTSWPITASKTDTLDITLDSPVTVTDPANTYVGVRVTMRLAMATYVATIDPPQWGADRSSAQYTVAGTYYRSADGTSWATYTSSPRTELAVAFTHGVTADPSIATISGTDITIPQGSLPAGPAGTYISTEDLGVAIVADYFIADKAPLGDIVRELIESAGLNPIMTAADLGMVTFYTVITSDYLTAIQGLIDTRGYGLKDTIMDAGTVVVAPTHTPDESPVLSVTTDPLGTGEKIILTHNLTVHWIAEKATVAYIAENSTSSGLPLALESDDGLMDGSLINALQVPLSSIVADNTLGTHDMIAHAVSGALRKLHTNVIEGTVSLAGYRPGIWDLAGAGCGGLPIALDVPEYQAQGVAIPTEVELADGVTVVRLDNIRTQDRNGVARSMGLVEGTVSNDATLLPKTVYIFGKVDDRRLNQILTDAEIEGLQVVALFRENDTGIGQTNATYLRTVTDEAGYLHLLAVFPADGGTWTSPAPITTALVNIKYVRGSSHFTEAVVACLDPPKYILDNQNIHVDIRVRKP